MSIPVEREVMTYRGLPCRVPDEIADTEENRAKIQAAFIKGIDEWAAGKQLEAQGICPKCKAPFIGYYYVPLREEWVISRGWDPNRVAQHREPCGHRKATFPANSPYIDRTKIRKG